MNIYVLRFWTNQGAKKVGQRALSVPRDVSQVRRAKVKNGLVSTTEYGVVSFQKKVRDRVNE